MAKAKQSFAEQFATAENIQFSGNNIYGKEVSVEMVPISGTDEIFKRRAEAMVLAEQAKKLRKKVDDGSPIAEVDVEFSQGMFEFYLRLLKDTVVLPDGQTMTDEQWCQFLINMGGSGSEICDTALKCIGLGKGDENEDDDEDFDNLPTTSSARSGADTDS